MFFCLLSAIRHKNELHSRLKLRNIIKNKLAILHPTNPALDILTKQAILNPGSTNQGVLIPHFDVLKVVNLHELQGFPRLC